ncbi:MAG: Mut7-C RNAse domain-containing protein [Candidatus Omnitrophica bacterium]|nr:Mut7-C RNAse domain-containing protein [Candidatus Omnitrophota bacterium]
MTRFLCDEQLGRLAKWLRLQGFDTIFQCPISDTELIRRAQLEGRIILTRDKHLADKTLWEAIVLIENKSYKEQLKEVGRKVRLPKSTPFSRCLECNTLIQSIVREEVRGLVPEEVYATYEKFYTCPVCKKIFWQGSHVQNSKKRLRMIIR